MARFDYIYTNFASGEISPLMEGRIDLEKYQSAAKLVENYRVMPHGPAVRRGGSRYIAKAKLDHTNWVRLIPFVSGSEGQFILELGHQYIRFYTAHGQLVGDGVGHPLDDPYEIVSPYNYQDLYNLDFAQDVNTMYIVHNSYDIQKLVRVDTYDWQLTVPTFTARPPEWIADNYPGAVGFHEQRLYLGGTRDQGQTFWGSKTGTYEDFTIGTNDDDAFKYTIATDKNNKIKWFSSGNTLMMGTEGAEFKVGSTDFKQAVTPTNIRVVRHTNYGSSDVRPMRMGDEVVYVQKGGLKVRNLIYSLQKDGYVSNDLTFLSEHITEGKIIDSDYQNEPDSIGWFVRFDGQLIGLSYEPELEVTGWFRYKMNNGLIKSVAVIDGYNDISHDEVWIVVDRYINGQWVKYIEIIEPSLKREEDQTKSFYVDSGLSTESAQLPATTITGLDHLEGETVQVLVDGWVHPDRVVTNGEIELTQEATIQVHAGLGTPGLLRTLRPEGGNPIGTSQGKIKRMKKVTVRLYRSLGLKIGDESLEQYYFGPPQPMNTAIELLSGDIEIEPDEEYSLDAEINIVQEAPLPSTIICVMPDLRTE